MPASINNRRSPMSTQGAAPMLRPFTTLRSPRLPPRSLCMTRNQYMPWPWAPRSLAPCHCGEVRVRDHVRNGELHFLFSCFALHRRVHGDVAAPFVCQVLAELEVLPLHRHLGLALEFPRPVSEVIAMPWRLRRERRQAEPFPDRLGLLHELALGQRDRRVGALERRVDQHGGAFAAVARAARPMPGILVRNYLEVVLGLAAVGHGPEQRIGVLGLDILIDGDDPFAGETVQRGGTVERAPDFALGRAARALDRDHGVEAGERL